MIRLKEPGNGVRAHRARETSQLTDVGLLQVIDDSMNDGLFNASLLSTQAGTIGRFCGNLLLSLCASITGAANPEQISALAATLFGSTLSMMAFSLLFVLVIYRRLIC